MEESTEDDEYFSLTSCLICPSPLSKCKYCNVSLNECKLEDHYTICQNAQWNRQCLSSDAKKALKKYARYEREDEIKIDLSNAIDIIAAQLDQQLIEEYFLVPRKDRVNFRDFFNPINPPLPLKLKIRDTTVDNKDKSGATKLLIHDSSDDEKEEKLKARKKKKTPYENCYLCKLDPTAQHLHVLGNQNTANNDEDNKDNKEVNDVAKKILEPFYESNNLYVSLTDEKSCLLYLNN
uniref:HIT-type domain-containing protein n=1 Tax=Strongyloides papillosus TaxID=174720 RepID=A0A0N5BS18_STREA